MKKIILSVILCLIFVIAIGLCGCSCKTKREYKPDSNDGDEIYTEYNPAWI